MDEHMVDRWNLVVRPQDKVYHLGDVTMSRKPVGLEIVKRLNGHKRLVLGNHDVMSCRDYLRYFEEVYASRVLDGMILTHIPIHPESMERFSANVHGHIHANAPFGEKYINVSMENVDYMPVALEDIKRNL
jgi:calcineurin-like phosphoesterase family protein